MIELMVVITLSLVMIGGVAVSLNRYYTKEKINSATMRLVSLINLARSNSVTRQSPAGNTSNLDFVSVSLDTDGNITASPNSKITGKGSPYFSENISTNKIRTTALSFYFGAGSGKLVDSSGNLLTSVNSVEIKLSSPESDDNVSQVLISSLGRVSFKLTDKASLALTPPPTPTTAPTITSTPVPTSVIANTPTPTSAILPTATPTTVVPTATLAPPTATPTIVMTCNLYCDTLRGFSYTGGVCSIMGSPCSNNGTKQTGGEIYCPANYKCCCK